MMESLALSFVSSPEARASDAFDIMPCDAGEVTGMFSVIGYKNVCALYAMILKDNAPDQFTPGALPLPPADARVKNILEMLRQAVTFVTSTGDDDYGKPALGVDGGPSPANQVIARECKLMDELFPFVMERKMYKYDLKHMNEKYILIHNTAFHVLKQCIQDNRRSEIYFANQSTAGWSWVDIVITQVGDIATAADLLNMLLSNNVTLLELFVTKETIQKFIDLICKDGPHKRFMAFFNAISSCNGNQIISNQELVLNAIVNNSVNQAGLMLSIFAAEPPAGQRKMPFKSLSDAAAMQKFGKVEDHGNFLGKEFHGDSGADAGFDQVYVSWSCPQHWEPGMDELFHSPHFLGINACSFESIKDASKTLNKNLIKRHWVQMHHLCWVLAPNNLCDSGYTLYDEAFGERDAQFDLVKEGGGKAASKKGDKIKYEYDKPGKTEKNTLWHEMPDIRAVLCKDPGVNGANIPLKVGEFQAMETSAHLPPAGRKYTNAQRFQFMVQLSSYFEAEIDVYAEMCLDRSYNSINALSTPKSSKTGEGGRGFSYDMLLSCTIDTRLPDQIRASFTMLLLRLWIDRFPHAQIPAPNPIQVFTGIRKITANDPLYALPQFEVDPSSLEPAEPGIELTPALEMHRFLTFGVDSAPGARDGEASNKFHMVEDYISDYLMAMNGCQVVEDVEKNTFTVNLLGALDKLVKFGFYGTTAEVVDLVDPLIATLDGRADLLTMEDFKKNMKLGDKKLDELMVRDFPKDVDIDRYELDENSQLVFDSKRSMINALVSICALRDDFRLRMIMNSFKTSIRTSKPLVRKEANPVDPSMHIWRFEQGFHNAFNDVFESPDGKALDLDEMSSSPLATILMDLMMYEYPELFEASLTLFDSHFSQRESLIKAIGQVQLMSTDQLPIYGSLTILIQDIAYIRTKLESYETWGVRNKFSGIEEEWVEQVISKIRNLMRFMVYEPIEAPVDAEDDDQDEEKVEADFAPTDYAAEYADPDEAWAAEMAVLWAKKPTREHQDILRNLDVHNIILRGTEIPFGEYDPGKWSEKKHGDTQSKTEMEHTFHVLLEIVNVCWESSKFFVKQNKYNQRIFVESIEPMTQVVRGIVDAEKMYPDFGVVTTVTETYRNNMPLLKKLTYAQIVGYAEIIAKANDKKYDVHEPLDYISFFDCCVFVEPRRYVDSAQRNVIRALKDHKLLNFDPLSTEEHHKKGLYFTAVPNQIKDRVFIRLLKLAASCCKKRNAYAQMVVTKQLEILGKKGDKTLFFNYLSECFKSEHLEFDVKIALADLLTSAYFDSSLVDKETNGAVPLWNLLKTLSEEFRKFAIGRSKNGIPEMDTFRKAIRFKFKSGGCLKQDTVQRRVSEVVADMPSADSKTSPYVKWERVEKAVKTYFPEEKFPRDLSKLRDRQHFFSSQETGFLPLMLAFIDNLHEPSAIPTGTDCEVFKSELLKNLCAVVCTPSVAKGEAQACAAYKKVAMCILDRKLFGDSTRDMHMSKTISVVELKNKFHLPPLEPKPERRRSTMTALLQAVQPKDLLKDDYKRRYFALVAEVANGRTDPPYMNSAGQAIDANDYGQLCADNSGTTEIQKMVIALTHVEGATKKTDEWKALYLKHDPASRADGRCNTVTFKDLAGRMFAHVTDNINKEIFSGYDTVGINCKVCSIMSNVLLETDGYDEKEPHVDEGSAFYGRQDQLARFGGVKMVLSVVAFCKEESMIVAALEFGNLMLKGGNIKVQEQILEFFAEGPEEKVGGPRTGRRTPEFFFQARKYIKAEEGKIIERRESRDLKLHVDDGPTVASLLIEFLTLWCEGHNLKMQNLLRQQMMEGVKGEPGYTGVDNKKNYNLLEDVASVIKIQCSPEEMNAGLSEGDLERSCLLLDFIIECMQGPCMQNQFHVGTATFIPKICKMFLEKTTKIYNKEKNTIAGIAEVRKKACVVLSALMEGSEQDEVHKTVVDQMDERVYKEYMIMLYEMIYRVDPSEAPNITAQQVGGVQSEELTAAHIAQKLPPFTEAELGTKDTALLVETIMSTGFDLYSVYKQLEGQDDAFKEKMKPNHPTDFDALVKEGNCVSYVKAHSKIENEVSRIEFLWTEELCTDPTSPCDLIYFPKPAVASALSPKSKMKMMEEVAFDNQDGKLRDFMERAHALVEEMNYIYFMSNKWRLGPIPLYPMFNFLTEYYLVIKQLAFMLVVLLNIVYAVSVEGPGNAMRTTFVQSGGEIVGADDEFGDSEGGGFWGTYDYGYHPNRFFGFWETKGYPGNPVDSVSWSLQGGVGMGPIGGKPTNGIFYTAYMVLVLTLTIIALYSICTGYLFISQLPLIARAHISHVSDALHEKFENSLTGTARLDYFQPAEFISWSKAFIFYLMMGLVFYIQYWEDPTYDPADKEGVTLMTWTYPNGDKEDVSLETYNTRKWAIQCFWGFGLSIFGPLFLKCYRRAVDTCIQYRYSVHPAPGPTGIIGFCITDPLAWFNKNYCIGYDALTDQDQFMNIIFNLFAFLSIHRFYYASLCLLDIVTISAGLKSTIKAVTEPILDLLEVLMLMVFVVFVFTVYGLYFFGQYYGTNLDDGMVGAIQYGADNAPNDDVAADDDATAYLSGLGVPGSQQMSTCPNLMICFFETLDQGLRSGDIVDAVFDSASFENGLSYADRVVFGMMFFLVVGVVLFDIVTGIILDKFGELREDSAARADYFSSTAFISGIENSAYEEVDSSFKFDVLNEEDQNRWAYVYFLAHLAKKSRAEYNGAETMVFKAIEGNDTSWMPSNKSYFWQDFDNKQNAAPDVDPVEVLQTTCNDLVTKIDALTSMVESLKKA